MDFEVEILLAIYNGENYVEELLDSLNRQTFKNWRILVSDDGSTDVTLSILENCRKKNSIEMHILPFEGIRLGPCKNFERLLARSSAPYVMFCDHDDVWLPQKTAMQLNEMKRLEERSGSEPCLVYSDLTPVNHDLSPRHDSFLENSRLNWYQSNNFYYICHRNPAPGCSIMLNRSAVRAVLPIGKKAVMHDWWCMLVVSKRGRVSCIKEPLLLYRFHSESFYGLKKVDEKPGRGVLAGRIMKFLSPGWYYRVLSNEFPKMAQVHNLRKTHGISFSLIYYIGVLFIGGMVSPILAKVLPEFNRLKIKV